MKLFKPHEATQIIAPYVPANPIIMEVGAFDGGETLRMKKRWPHSTIHAFEPVPEIFKRLVHNTRNLTNVHCYNAALSTENGAAEFFVAEKKNIPGVASQAGSLHQPRTDIEWLKMNFPRTIKVHTVTPATWAQQHGITHVDLVWLDTQGHELPILKAFPAELLATIRAIHVEVALTPRFEQQASYDAVMSWLKKHHFVEVARDFDASSDVQFGNSLCVNTAHELPIV